MPDNLTVLTRIADLIRRSGARQGRAQFLQSDDYARALMESNDVAQSLLGQFDHPRAEETVIKLERIPRDAPCDSRAGWQAIAAPTLVLGNRQDPVHPFAFAEALAASIPGAELKVVTPKSESVTDHTRDVQQAILDFFNRRIANNP